MHRFLSAAAGKPAECRGSCSPADSVAFRIYLLDWFPSSDESTVSLTALIGLFFCVSSANNCGNKLISCGLSFALPVYNESVSTKENRCASNIHDSKGCCQACVRYFPIVPCKRFCFVILLALFFGGWEAIFFATLVSSVLSQFSQPSGMKLFKLHVPESQIQLGMSMYQTTS